uniref:AlNc14C264G9858 protein n=1 Tax=Albugo laibachii Nc14 TaxID=890382 RepID=F0WU35_9STRA|nr:AlNc14C264G9858 [Albugo laibachii Nc14]|eukprot:CCA24880.1 AlNc14C264G9858 [Albugo laibachii Nc14]
MVTHNVYALREDLLLFRQLQPKSNASDEEIPPMDEQEFSLDQPIDDFPPHNPPVGGGVSLFSVIFIVIGILFVILLMGAMEWRKKRQRHQAKKAYSGQHEAMLRNGAAPRLPDLPTFQSSNYSEEGKSATSRISNLLHNAFGKHTPQEHIGPSENKYDAMGDLDRKPSGQFSVAESVRESHVKRKLISIQKTSPSVLPPSSRINVKIEQKIEAGVRDTSTTIKELPTGPPVDADFCHTNEKNTTSAVFLRRSEDDEEIAI